MFYILTRAKKGQNSRFNLLTTHQIHLAHRFYAVTISLKYSYYKLTRLFHVYLALNRQLTYFLKMNIFNLSET